MSTHELSESMYLRTKIEQLFLSKCFHCDKVAVWRRDRLLYPNIKGGVEPNEDTPEDVLADYREAQEILQLSPRGAAALLRLAIQKLCYELGCKKKNLNDAIGELVENGLDTRIQKALDSVRVVGNESVHPGQLDMKDDVDTAEKLFKLVNIIVDEFITKNRIIDQVYDEKVPEKQKKGIFRRDKKKAE